MNVYILYNLFKSGKIKFLFNRLRSKIHLNILEATYIFLDRPSLCRQKPSHNLHVLGDILSSGVTKGSSSPHTLFFFIIPI